MKRIISLILILIAIALLSGCAASLEGVKVEKVTLCENQRCRYLTDADSKEELLVKIFNLLKGSEDKDSDLFESSPENRTFKKKGIGFFVQGGPIPGKATRTSTKFTDVLYIDRENMEIKFKVLDKQTWLAIPVITATAEGILSMKSLTEIKVNYSGFASGIIVGASGQSTEWLIDYIDLDNKVLGAHYAISIAGLGFGGGSGYHLVKLAEGDVKPLPAPQKIVSPKITTEPPRIIPPALFANIAFTETSGNRILEGGEEAVLRVDVENKGEGAAKDVQVILSGNQTLVGYLGEKKSIGDIGAKEKKIVEAGGIDTIFLRERSPPRKGEMDEYHVHRLRD